MFPELISFGRFAIHTYGVLVATGFLAGVALSVREARRVGLDGQKMLDLCFYLVISAILGSRLLYVLMNLRAYLDAPLDIFKIWEGGLVFSGGLVGALIVGFLLVLRWKMNPWQTADLVAPGIAIGQAIGRIGCFFAGCCYGKPTDAFCAVTFNNPDTLAPRGIPLHPTQLYSSASLFLIFLVLWLFRKHKTRHGQVICLYIFLHSTARLIIERFRGDFRGEVLHGALTVTQLVSICLMVISVGLWLFFRRGRGAR